ncbi:MAG: hypothetical protein EA383_13765, partial [Spirochaetaceae bacterium]
HARTLDERGGFSEFNALAVDGSGNVYAAGWQTRDRTYSYGPGVDAAGSAGSRNAVVVSYDSDLNAQWATTTTEGDVSSEFYAIAVDNQGTIYAAGYKRGNDMLAFAEEVTVAGSFAGASYGDENVLLVAYNTNGAAKTARTTEAGSGDTVFSGVAASSTDAIAVGRQRGTITFAYGDDLEAAGSAPAWPNAVIVRY